MKNLKFDIITFDNQTDHNNFVIKFFHALNKGTNIVLCIPNQVDYVASELNKINATEKGQEDIFNGKQYICFLTSGSSGRPKIVFHSFDSLKQSVESFLEFFKLDESNPSYISLPLNHVGGFLQFLRAQVIGAPFSFSHDYLSMVNNVEDHGVFSFVPAQLLELEKRGDLQKLSKAKLVLLGGQAPELSLLKRWNKLIPNLAISYGLTESAAVLAGDFVRDLDIVEDKIFASILPKREVELRKGNIFLSGHGICHGILLEGALESTEGIMTSDMGQLHKGKLAVIGRSDLVFISGGENIDPVKIENSVAKNLGMKGITIPIHHEKFGQCPALIVEDQDYKKLSSFKEFKDKISDLAHFEIPKLIFPYQFDKNAKPNRAQIKRDILATSNKLLSLHGFFGSAKDFQKLFINHPLKERMIHFDIPGVANENIPNNKEELFDQLKRLIEKESVTHYLGYSLGGRILIEGIVEGKLPNLPIMLIASNPGLEPAGIEKRKAWEESIRDDLNKLSAHDFFTRWYELGLFQGLKNNKNYKSLLENRISTYHSRLSESFDFYSIAKTKNYWNKLGLLKGYYLSGEEDIKYCEFGDRINEDSEISLVHKKIPESSHYCHWQNPQEFFFLFNQFFS
ncbi:MAG: AMP-binding protein [Oligoflexia bacterium]|nr:AMP-binding protein [Oligoflexia bacterium]